MERNKRPSLKDNIGFGSYLVANPSCLLPITLALFAVTRQILIVPQGECAGSCLSIPESIWALEVQIFSGAP